MAWRVSFRAYFAKSIRQRGTLRLNKRGSSWILREWIPETVFRGDYERRFSVALMRKDMGLITALAEELSVPAPALALATETFQRALEGGYGDLDFSVVAALQAQAAGTELPGGPPPR